jgi:hypothetical protein
MHHKRAVVPTVHGDVEPNTPTCKANALVLLRHMPTSKQHLRRVKSHVTTEWSPTTNGAALCVTVVHSFHQRPASSSGWSDVASRVPGHMWLV